MKPQRTPATAKADKQTERHTHTQRHTHTHTDTHTHRHTHTHPPLLSSLLPSWPTQVDPKQLLEDGIRKELVNQVAAALDSLLTFEVQQKGREVDLKQRLNKLATRLQGIRRSFEYIQVRACACVRACVRLYWLRVCVYVCACACVCAKLEGMISGGCARWAAVN